MQLRPPEFEIDDDQKPFDNDRLSRRPRIEALTRVIVAEDGPAVISVNGGFGTGKSAFMRMLAANPRLQDGVEVQEFNAWQQSYTDDPLVDLVYGCGVRQAAHSTTVEALLPAFPALPGMAGHIFGRSEVDESPCVHRLREQSVRCPGRVRRSDARSLHVRACASASTRAHAQATRRERRSDT